MKLFITWALSIFILDHCMASWDEDIPHADVIDRQLDDELFSLFGLDLTQFSSASLVDDQFNETHQPPILPKVNPKYTPRGSALPVKAGSLQTHDKLTEESKEAALKHLFGDKHCDDPEKRQLTKRLAADLPNKFAAVQSSRATTVLQVLEHYKHEDRDTAYMAIRSFLASYYQRGWLALDTNGYCVLTSTGLFGLKALKEAIDEQGPQKKKLTRGRALETNALDRSSQLQATIQKITKPKPFLDLLVFLTGAGPLTKKGIKEGLKAARMVIPSPDNILDSLASKQLVTQDLNTFQYSITNLGRQAIPLFEAQMNEVQKYGDRPVEYTHNSSDEGGKRPKVNISKLLRPDIHRFVLVSVQEAPAISQPDLIARVNEVHKCDKANIASTYIDKQVKFGWLSKAKHKGKAHLSITPLGQEYLEKFAELTAKRKASQKRQPAEAELSKSGTDIRKEKKSKQDSTHNGKEST